MILDRKELLILDLLSQNARLSLRKIAKRLGISLTAVTNRVRRLENSGIIKRYTVDIDHSVLGFDIPVLIDVRVERGMLFEVERKIADHPNVLAVYDVTGDFDVAVLALFRSRRELDSFVKSLQRIEYIERTYTKLILNVIKDERNVDLLRIFGPALE